MITTILIGKLHDLLHQELFFTVRLIVQAWKQMTVLNSVLYRDMVSISIHSNVFIVCLMTVAVSQIEGDWVMNWKGSIRNLVCPNWRYCLPVVLTETIQAHHIWCSGTSSASQTPHILWNMVVHSCVHKSLSLARWNQSVPSQPVYLRSITKWCNCEYGDRWRQCDSSSSSACITMLMNKQVNIAVFD